MCKQRKTVSYDIVGKRRSRNPDKSGSFHTSRHPTSMCTFVASSYNFLLVMHIVWLLAREGKGRSRLIQQRLPLWNKQKRHFYLCFLCSPKFPALVLLSPGSHFGSLSLYVHRFTRNFCKAQPIQFYCLQHTDLDVGRLTDVINLSPVSLSSRKNQSSENSVKFRAKLIVSLIIQDCLEYI